MKKIKFAGALLLAVVLLNGCKKINQVEETDQTENAPTRNAIKYNMSVIPRVDGSMYENKYMYANGDTLIIKVNGNVVASYKGSIPGVPNVGSSPLGPYQVKTGDKIEVYYSPGKVTLTNGTNVYDENGLMISLDYDLVSNQVLKEYSCRCVTNFVTTLE